MKIQHLYESEKLELKEEGSVSSELALVAFDNILEVLNIHVDEVLKTASRKSKFESFKEELTTITSIQLPENWETEVIIDKKVSSKKNKPVEAEIQLSEVTNWNENALPKGRGMWSIFSIIKETSSLLKSWNIDAILTKLKAGELKNWSTVIRGEKFVYAAKVIFNYFNKNAYSWNETISFNVWSEWYKVKQTEIVASYLRCEEWEAPGVQVNHLESAQDKLAVYRFLIFVWAIKKETTIQPSISYWQTEFNDDNEIIKTSLSKEMKRALKERDKISAFVELHKYVDLLASAAKVLKKLKINEFMHNENVARETLRWKVNKLRLKPETKTLIEDAFKLMQKLKEMIDYFVIHHNANSLRESLKEKWIYIEMISLSSDNDYRLFINKIYPSIITYENQHVYYPFFQLLNKLSMANIWATNLYKLEELQKDTYKENEWWKTEKKKKYNNSSPYLKDRDKRKMLHQLRTLSGLQEVEQCWKILKQDISGNKSNDWNTRNRCVDELISGIFRLKEKGIITSSNDCNACSTYLRTLKRWEVAHKANHLLQNNENVQFIWNKLFKLLSAS